MATRPEPPPLGVRARTKFRRLDGILLLDKPSGMSSNQALQRVRHLLRAEKAGHTGSLDPLATGLLPICFGEATKIAGLLLGSRKAYETTARLGTTTDTDDADGQPLLERPVPSLDAARLESALAPLRGRIRQRAPIYSALKQGGEPLYARARRGETVEAPEREVLVHELRVTSFSGDQVGLHVECGSGTYVRSLVRDLGEALGCGAHVMTLRRTWVDPFRFPQMVTLDALSVLHGDDGALESHVLPLDAGLVGFRSVRVTTDAVRRFRHGQPLAIDAADLQPAPVPSAASDLGPEAPVVVREPDGRPLGLASLAGDSLRPQRLFAGS